jgi:Ca2+-binding EF-hand superfamily protein
LLQVFGFAMVETQFEAVMQFKQNAQADIDIQVLFDVLDNDNDGRIDGLEFLAGVALVCQASVEEKARCTWPLRIVQALMSRARVAIAVCFELYDFNLNSSLSKAEMVSWTI